jgi:tRNA (uracil-5-)-methyltransferase
MQSYYAKDNHQTRPDVVIDDVPFDIGYMIYDVEQYDAFLDRKTGAVVDQLVANHILSSDSEVQVQVNSSPEKYFRQRCRFSVLLNSVNSSFEYLMWEADGTPKYVVKSFPIASAYINAAMPVLKKCMESRSLLLLGLNSVHFIVTLVGNMIITLLYEVDISNEEWRSTAVELKAELEHELRGQLSSVQIVGRGSRRSKVVLDTDSIQEVFTMSDGRTLRYVQVIDGFSNPNAIVNIKSLEFMCSIIQGIPGLGVSSEFDQKNDLLEMYCGMGNHTVAVARYAHRVIAIEINKHLCEAARKNLELNQINNAEILTGDSKNFAQRVLRQKRYVSYKRNKGGEEYSFGAVIVDPPRCGLDSFTLSMLAGYDHIIYISCNPDALTRDLKVLNLTHSLKRLAVFDHFPYTPHIESGVYLIKRSVSSCTVTA